MAVVILPMYAIVVVLWGACVGCPVKTGAFVVTGGLVTGGLLVNTSSLVGELVLKGALVCTGLLVIGGTLVNINTLVGWLVLKGALVCTGLLVIGGTLVNTNTLLGWLVLTMPAVGWLVGTGVFVVLEWEFPNINIFVCALVVTWFSVGIVVLTDVFAWVLIFTGAFVNTNSLVGPCIINGLLVVCTPWCTVDDTIGCWFTHCTFCGQSQNFVLILYSNPLAQWTSEEIWLTQI